MECFGDCVTQHKAKHGEEYGFAGPDVCAGKPAGLRVYSPSLEVACMSEIHAYSLSIKYLENKLRATRRSPCDKCRPLTENELQSERDRLRGFEYWFERRSNHD